MLGRSYLRSPKRASSRYQQAPCLLFKSSAKCCLYDSDRSSCPPAHPMNSLATKRPLWRLCGLVVECLYVYASPRIRHARHARYGDCFASRRIEPSSRRTASSPALADMAIDRLADRLAHARGSNHQVCLVILRSLSCQASSSRALAVPESMIRIRRLSNFMFPAASSTSLLPAIACVHPRRSIARVAKSPWLRCDPRPTP